MAGPDDKSQALDDDVVYGDFPPERPLGVDERLTPREEQGGEDLARRLAREEPDVEEHDDDLLAVGTLVAPGAEGGLDDEATEVALEVGDDHDGTLWDVTQEKQEDRPAEEAAMHLTDPPPMGDGDGYLEE